LSPVPEGVWSVSVVPLDRDLVAEYHFKVTDNGVPVISEVRVAAVPITHFLAEQPVPDDAPVTGDGITARALRKVPVGPEVIADQLKAPPVLAKWGLDPTGFRLAATKAPRRPGSRGRPDLYYAQLAQAYAERVAAGSRSPVADLARELSSRRQPFSHAYIRDQVHEARRRGLLTKPPRGKPGGVLTDKARRELLREDTDTPKRSTRRRARGSR
jgi:hypothetical protein